MNSASTASSFELFPPPRITGRGRRRGFATVTAIVIMGLVGATATAMVTMISADYHRTRRLADEAQMRQMFLAGNAQVLDQAQNWNQQPPTEKTLLALPDVLRADEASLVINIAPQGNDAVQVTMTARIAKHQSREDLTLKRSDGKWRIDSSQLVQ